jgi:hypothetical protein
MNGKAYPMILTAAALLLASAVGRAQHENHGQQQPPAQAGQQGNKQMDMQHASMNMSKMIDDGHDVLAMAYMQNVAAFAGTLKDRVDSTKSVDADFARSAVAEMRRSFDSIQQHHQAHMATMGSADSTMLRMMHHMDSTMAVVGEHLTALEAEVNGSAPDPGKVTEHVTAILKHHDGMSAMHGKAKPHQM